MPMKDSRMTDAWIAQVVAGNPFHISPKSGNIITCPLRLAWTDQLFKASKGTNDDGTDKRETFGCAALLPPGSQSGIDTILWPKWYELANEHFSKLKMPDGRFPPTVHWPLHMQDEKAGQYGGYTPGQGLFYFNTNTERKPQITDPSGTPVFGDDRVYPGVWAIMSLNVYAYGLKPGAKKKGVSFGLVQIMLIADDERLGGAAPAPQDDFTNVKITADFVPNAAFQNAPAAPPPGGYAPPSAVLPPAQQVSRPPAAPGYGAPPPPPPPQQAWAPPAATTRAEDFFW